MFGPCGSGVKRKKLDALQEQNSFCSAQEASKHQEIWLEIHHGIQHTSCNRRPVLVLWIHLCCLPLVNKEEFVFGALILKRWRKWKDLHDKLRRPSCTSLVEPEKGAEVRV